MLRAALVILVMLNLGAAGWWIFGPAPRAPRPEPLDAPQLQLVSERTPPPTPAAATAPPGTCLRFGPFAGPAARNGARASLASAGVDSVPFEDQSGAARGWDVYLPAQPSRADAEALAARLKAEGVEDLMVLREGDNANRIALGRFSSEAGAQRRVAELQAKGMTPLIQPRGGGKTRVWLDARLPTGMKPDKLAAIAPSRPLDCSQLR